jgi:hypothetical protein
VRNHEIDKQQLVGFLRNYRVLTRTEFFRMAARYLAPLVRTDNALRGFYRQRIARLSAFSTDNGS